MQNSIIKIFGSVDVKITLTSVLKQTRTYVDHLSLMTAMSCECWLQVKDKRDSSNLKRYRAQLGLCYGGPLIITLMTLIVEFGAARCSAIRPKFAEESCFFAGKFIFK